MCNIEETTVRDEAVASLNLIGKQMEPEQIKAELLPMEPSPSPSPKPSPKPKPKPKP